MLNHAASQIVGEDHLGIRYVSILIADQLQHGITSITPRARYWSFYAWVLYDFINSCERRSMKEFKLFLKKQEWFFILANIASAEGKTQSLESLIGVTKGKTVWDQNYNDYPLDLDYVKHSLGGFGAAYRNVMKLLGITCDGNKELMVEIDRITPVGKELAQAFESVVKETRYYKEYRLSDKNVPRDVLYEYGKCVNLDGLAKSTDELQILREIFIPKNPTGVHCWRCASFEYYKYIKQQNSDEDSSLKFWRKVMYDQFYDLSGSIKIVSKGWEIYHGRQLFTYSLESIWSYTLAVLSKKSCSYEELIKQILNELAQKIDLEISVANCLRELPLSVDTRERYLEDMSSDHNTGYERVYLALCVLFDVYHRFDNRSDITENQFLADLLKEGDREHISLQFWMDTVRDHLNDSIGNLLTKIIKQFILTQHQMVALNKLLTTRNDTYHFVEDEGKLYFISGDSPRFNVFRVFQGLSILKDLDWLGVA